MIIVLFHKLIVIQDNKYYILIMIDIQLNVKGCKTLRDSFKDYIQEEILEGYNKYQATGYGLQVS
jgi:hypothetical protein